MIFAVNNKTNLVELFRKALNSDDPECIFSIEMQPFGFTDNQGFLSDLTKIFPISDNLAQSGKKVTIKIKKCAYDIKARILPLIFAQAIESEEDKNISIQYDDLPVHCIAGPYPAKKYTPFFNKNNLEEKYKKDTQKLLKSAKVASVHSEGRAKKRIILVDELLDSNTQTSLINNIRDVNAQKNLEISFWYKQESISNIFPIISVSDFKSGNNRSQSNDVPLDIFALNMIPDALIQSSKQLSHLIHLEQSFIDNINNNKIFQGYVSNNIQAPNKDRLKKEFLDYYNDKKTSMSFVGRLIWISILRNMIERKELLVPFVTVDEINEWTLNSETIERSVLSCATYAEGLYQIIENSCLYSHGHKAYFGMRMYRLSPSENTDVNLSHARTKAELYEKYKNCFKKDLNGSVSNKNIFSSDYQNLFEFYVIDDAVSGEGILYKSRSTIKEKVFSSLKELIEYKPEYVAERAKPAREYADKIAHHYGMRVFFNNIERNDGCIILETPYDPESRMKEVLYHSIREKNEIQSSNENCFLTSYNILVPIYPYDKTINSTSDNKTENKDHSFLNEGNRCSASCVRFDKIDYNNVASKEEKIEIIKNTLLSGIDNDRKNILLAVNAFSCSVCDSELLAKAIFKLTAEYCAENTLKIAVLFSSKSNCPQEFIRIFSSFYDKLNSDDKDTQTFVVKILGNLQIAVCTKENEGMDGEISVNFVLSGNSPGSAYISARNYLYVNFDSCVQYIPLLKYLALSPDVKKKTNSVFPFDLYLSKTCFEEQNLPEVSPQKDCLFLDRMNRILNSDLQMHSDGCRIPDIHIRLGSKIHLNCFYEAELLFRSVVNIQRFAYIITDHILSKINLMKGKKNIIIVGYEKYSAELILQINKLLRSFNISSGAFLVPAVGEEKEQCIELSSLSENKKKKTPVSETNPKTVMLVTVIPVGSTMSTVYKVKHTIKNEYRKKHPDTSFTDLLDYCIVAINSQIKKPKEKNDVTWQFWRSVDTDKKEIIVLPDRSDGKDITVNYLLSGDADWFSSLITSRENDQCEMCKELNMLEKSENSRYPLLQVDKTSMIPTSIFKLKNGKTCIIPPKNVQHNKERIIQLKGNIEYGHIYSGDNHYQFYIDHKKLYQQYNEEIDTWLKNVEVDHSAFNIVISPNDNGDTLFVSSALDNIFGNSMRFLHIDISNAYREDIRLKFSKIAEEYKYLRMNMPDTKLNIYYISNTLVSAKTLARAKLLMCTLLDESGITWQYAYVFKKIILLICSSSFSTMKQFVEFPVKQVEAYIQLNIPQYNTIADKCPACKLQDEYVLLRKRCTTAELSQSFERLENKSRKRTLSEYRTWQNEEILTNHSYYARLKSWIYFHKNAPEIDLSDKEILSVAFEKDSIEILKSISGESDENKAVSSIRDNSICDDQLTKQKHREIFKEKLHERTLSDIIEIVNQEVKNKNAKVKEKSEIIKEYTPEDIVDIVKRTVVSDHNYKRLYCMQRAYEELILLNADECDTVDQMNKKLDSLTRAKILEIISQELKSKPTDKSEFSENAEWLISFIKVISREHLSRYYHIRKAIVNIMYDMIGVLSFDDNSDKNKIKDTLLTEDKNWEPILYTLRFYEDDTRTIRSVDNSLCASLQYELFMTLVHRLSVMQCSVVYQNKAIEKTLSGFNKLNQKYFGLNGYNMGKDSDELLKYTELPSNHEIRNRYIKSIKTATMLTANDDPCYQLLTEGEKND